MTGYARRNHYLPQSYLRRFCDASGKVVRTFRGPDGALRERRFVPKGTGFERDLYTYVPASPLLPTSRPDFIETDVFGPIDHNGAIVLERLMASAPSQLSEDERVHLAIYINALLERHPQRIYGRDRAAKRVARARLAALREQFGPPPADRPDIFELVDVEKLARNFHREHMVREIQSSRAVEYLKSMQLAKLAIQTDSSFSFIVGDNPVLVNGGQEPPLYFFTIALAPHVLLLGVNSKQVTDLDLTDARTVFELALIHNLQLLAQCEYVFSRDPLEDNVVVKMRRAAQISLKPVTWKGAAPSDERSGE